MHTSAETSETATVLWLDPYVESTGQAVLYTLAYSDVFDYPLTVGEIWRYLIGRQVPQEKVGVVLETLAGVETDGRFYYLSGRAAITEIRRARADVAAQMWSRVGRYAATIAQLPFVRMVALTGALAVVNARANDDYDFLIVTEPGYLWLTRALVIALVVRPSALWGDEICPNYFITADNLAFHSRDLFTAHELTQMVPVVGQELYADLRARNAWVDAFLPNAQGAPSQFRDNSRTAARWLSRRLAEPLLRNNLGERLDRWEMTRKIPQLVQEFPNPEVALGRNQCKGHTGAHRTWVRERFAERVRRVQSIVSAPNQV